MNPLMLIRFAPWGLAGALAVAVGIQTVRLADARTDAAETAAGHALALAEQESQARAAERAHVAAMADIETEHLEEMTDAKADLARLSAELVAGTQRLRQRFTCPAAVVPGSKPAAGADHEPAGLLPADVGVLVGIARECDGQVRALQSVIRRDRDD